MGTEARGSLLGGLGGGALLGGKHASTASLGGGLHAGLHAPFPAVASALLPLQQRAAPQQQQQLGSKAGSVGEWQTG